MEQNNYNDPLHINDTSAKTYGCRHTNPKICKNNMLPGRCAFAREDKMCLIPPSSWKKKFEKFKQEAQTLL